MVTRFGYGPSLIAEILRVWGHRSFDGRCRAGLLDQIVHSPSTAFDGSRSGIPELDAITDGWQPGQSILIAGRPSMGKTAFLLYLLDAIAYRQPAHIGVIPSLLLSLEMGRLEMGERQICLRADVPNTKLKN